MDDPVEKEDEAPTPPKWERRRKNWMKNKPCVCSSGRKFKNCCWAKYAHKLLPEYSG